MTSKQIYFAVYYDTENGNFWIDDETLMARFGTASWWDDDTEDWRRPESDDEEKFDSAVSAKLGQLRTRKGEHLLCYRRFIRYGSQPRSH